MKAKDKVESDLYYFPNIEDLIRHYELNLEAINKEIYNSDVLSYTQVQRLERKYEHNLKCLNMAKGLKS